MAFCSNMLLELRMPFTIMLKQVPVGAQTTKTKDTWRNVTRVRATAEWPGLYFGRVANGVTSGECPFISCESFLFSLSHLL